MIYFLFSGTCYITTKHRRWCAVTFGRFKGQTLAFVSKSLYTKIDHDKFVQYEGMAYCKTRQSKTASSFAFRIDGKWRCGAATSRSCCISAVSKSQDSSMYKIFLFVIDGHHDNQFFFTQIHPTSFLQIVDMYKATLSSYGHEQLPRYHSAKSFDSRVDSLLVLMARQAICLTNLVRAYIGRSSDFCYN